MKRWVAIVLVSLAVVLGLFLYLWHFGSTEAALTLRHVELIFIVRDRNTSQSIQNAVITLNPFEWANEGPGWRFQEKQVITDIDGRARTSRVKVMSDELHKPLRPPTIGFSIPLSSIDVTAEGFQPLKDVPRHELEFANRGYDQSREAWQLEYGVRLERREER